MKKATVRSQFNDRQKARARGEEALKALRGNQHPSALTKKNKARRVSDGVRGTRAGSGSLSKTTPVSNRRSSGPLRGSTNHRTDMQAAIAASLAEQRKPSSTSHGSPPASGKQTLTKRSSSPVLLPPLNKSASLSAVPNISNASPPTQPNKASRQSSAGPTIQRALVTPTEAILNSPVLAPKKLTSMEEYVAREKLRREAMRAQQGGQQRRGIGAPARSSPNRTRGVSPEGKSKPTSSAVSSKVTSRPTASKPIPTPARMHAESTEGTPAQPSQPQSQVVAKAGTALYIPAHKSSKKFTAPPKLSEKPVPYKERKTQAMKENPNVGKVPVDRSLKRVLHEGKVSRVLTHKGDASGADASAVRAARAAYLDRMAASAGEVN